MSFAFDLQLIREVIINHYMDIYTDIESNHTELESIGVANQKSRVEYIRSVDGLPVL